MLHFLTKVAFKCEMLVQQHLQIKSVITQL